jgi:hypothetical protein
VSYRSPKSLARYTNCYLPGMREIRGKRKKCGVHFEISEQETSWENLGSILEIQFHVCSRWKLPKCKQSTRLARCLLLGLLIYSIASAFINSFSAVTIRNQSSVRGKPGSANRAADLFSLPSSTPFFPVASVEFNARSFVRGFEVKIKPRCL